ncbi:MAG TPA: site-specific integrase [Phenylobacterium sp.]
MSAESHAIMDGKVHVYRREKSRYWQCAAYVGGRNHRQSTGHADLALAFDFARSWYADRCVDERMRERGLLPARPAPKKRVGPPKRRKRGAPRAPGERTFRDVAEVFVREFELMTAGERNPAYVRQKSQILDRHLLPFFGDKTIQEVSAGLIQAYRVHRLEPPADDKPPSRPTHIRIKGKLVRKAWKPWKRPTRSTMHNEIVCLRQVLKTACRYGWLSALPDMSAPYRKSGKITHRGWFSPEEYKALYQATRERAKTPKKERWRTACEQLHDWVLFMVNTGLRPDEGKRLEFRDVSVVVDEASGERILEIQVRGKRGVGYCKSMPGAVQPFLRVRKRKDPKPSDLVFGEIQRELFNAILNELDFKKDREGNARTAYSLRHTYICLRLMEGADIYQVAKNCRTSVEMIEKYYAVHLKDTLDAAAINVRRSRPSRPARTAKAALPDA